LPLCSGSHNQAATEPTSCAESTSGPESDRGDPESTSGCPNSTRRPPVFPNRSIQKELDRLAPVIAAAKATMALRFNQNLRAGTVFPYYGVGPLAGVNGCFIIRTKFNTLNVIKVTAG
jgi:hypothetical protein